MHDIFSNINQKHTWLQLLPLLHLGLEASGLGRHLKTLQHRAPHHQRCRLDQDWSGLSGLEAQLLHLVLPILLGALLLVQRMGELLRHKPQVLWCWLSGHTLWPTVPRVVSAAANWAPLLLQV